MSVIDDALRSLRERLEEVDREAGRLRAAIAAVEVGLAPLPVLALRAGAHAASPVRPRIRKRARPGENRRRILAAIEGEAKTAGTIEAETGISAAVAGAALYKLMRAGKVRKAVRGYIAVNGH